MAVGLEVNGHAIRFVNLGAHRCTNDKRRIYTSTGEIDTIDNLLAVFLKSGLIVAVKLKWEPTPILNTCREPQPGLDLVHPAGNNVLR